MAKRNVEGADGPDVNTGEPPFKVEEQRADGPVFVVKETANGSVWGRHATKTAANRQIEEVLKEIAEGRVPRRPEGIVAGKVNERREV